MRKNRFFFILVLFSIVSFAQKNHKYAIIPYQFSFVSEHDKYGLNSLTKSFLQSEGFEVYYDNEQFPEELSKNRCLSIVVEPFEIKALFMIKIVIDIKDCSNNLLMKSEIGVSREKEYKIAYNQSLRQALNSLKGKLNFKVENLNSVEETIEIKTTNNSNSIINTSQLRTVATATGFDLINFSNNRIFILHTTSLKNVFIAYKDIYKGLLLNKNNAWFFEYDFEGKIYSEKVDVQF